MNLPLKVLCCVPQCSSSKRRREARFDASIKLFCEFGLKGLNFYTKPCLSIIIIHQTHYEKSDWSRAFNQFTIACELDMINAISVADIAFIM